MTGSVGAASAAMSGRGNRATEEESTYPVVLPGLPTGRFVVNTVFLHADIRARPYRVEDFRDTLSQHELLADVVALGAYRMSHVWAVTLKDSEAVTKIVSVGELLVKGNRCLVIDPANQDVRLKLHWLLHNVPDEDVRAAFAPYGKVTEVSRERWRVRGVSEKGSTTRLVTLKLKAGVKLDDLPHQLNVSGELALVVVPGRPPLCLRCRNTAHIRKDCRVPRCGACRRFGHEDGQCARTYASIAGPGTSEDSSELLMDEADAEEAARETGQPATRDGPTLTPLTKHSATTSNAVAAAVEVQREVQPESEGKLEDTTTVSAKLPTTWSLGTLRPWISARRLPP
ncbi:uncharacterized protein LOC125943446 [Dermacentor silvarum]|uniref:uncharacterized protein LOC125943446 n=1 Tax=Dermacentor silvarum TaxID=543639 RepID=UPI002100A6DD|nr:uncharacterized protein LOC125943446 [Dermacentor silvarum]